ncbi:MAG: hypothetical protein J7L66_01595 [Anaerolineaceae bacterium]|nr:hypothetical protein [Anaerolineaceae bacterium]
MAALSACTPASQPIQAVQTNTSEPAPLPAVGETETVLPPPGKKNYLIGPLEFSAESAFCEDEPENSPFSVACAEGKLTVTQADNRRKIDIYLFREKQVTAQGFVLSAQATSHPAANNKIDQNNFGFFYKTSSGAIYALRIQGQYFNFEQWDLSEGTRVVDAYNRSYAPELFYAEQVNDIRLTCQENSCDLFANGAFIGRSPYHDASAVTSIGFFTASAWDQQFGSITLDSFSVADLPGSVPKGQPFSLMDDLSADHGTFSQMGLSGAFSDFETDGFHFSPVIPFGYYAAKTGPSLTNMSVRVSLDMDFSPGVKATQYGGVVCRSSLEGMYIAVLRVDGTYSIYRDTPRHPFALLVKENFEKIQGGRSKHTLRLDCVDDTISFYIDDIPLESFLDKRYSIRFGRAGLYTKAGGSPYSDAIIFSDFKVEEIR